MPRQSRTPEQCREIIERVNKHREETGATLYRTCQDLGIKYGSVHAIMKKAGIDFKKHSKRKQKQITPITLIAEPMRNDRIAVLLGPETTITRILETLRSM